MRVPGRGDRLLPPWRLLVKLPAEGERRGGPSVRRCLRAPLRCRRGRGRTSSARAQTRLSRRSLALLGEQEGRDAAGAGSGHPPRAQDQSPRRTGLLPASPLPLQGSPGPLQTCSPPHEASPLGASTHRVPLPPGQPLKSAPEAARAGRCWGAGMERASLRCPRLLGLHLPGRCLLGPGWFLR